MNRFVLRYGVFFILALMAGGICWILSGFSLRTKIPVSLYVENEIHCKLYVPREMDARWTTGDSVNVIQTLGGNLSFVVVDTLREPAHDVLIVRAVDASGSVSCALGGNTISDGFIYSGQRKFASLLFKR